jgi:hypothetical protein
VRRTYEIALNEVERDIFLELEDTEGLFSIWSEVNGIMSGDAGPRSIRYTVDVKRDTPELHEAFLKKLKAYVASEIAEDYPHLAELPESVQEIAVREGWGEQEAANFMANMGKFKAL